MVELGEGELEEQIDATTQQDKCIPERLPLRGLVPRDLGGIRHPPMGHDRLAGEDRAGFLRSIAHGDHKIPRLTLEPVDAARRMAGPRNAAFAQGLDRVGIDLRGRSRAGARRLEPPLCLPINNASAIVSARNCRCTETASELTIRRGIM